MRRHAEAVEESRRSQLLDPLNPGVNTSYAFVLVMGREFTPAIRFLQQMIQSYPDSAFAHEYLALAYDGNGNYAEAVAEYRKFIRLDQGYTFIKALLAHACFLAGQRQEGEAILKELETGREYVSPTLLSVAYLGKGDRESALRQLERGVQVHDNQMQYINAIWLFDSLRQDPRFQIVLRRVGFPG